MATFQKKFKSMSYADIKYVLMMWYNVAISMLIPKINFVFHENASKLIFILKIDLIFFRFAQLENPNKGKKKA